MRPTVVRVRVLSFGPWRGRLAEGGEWCEVMPGASVADLLSQLESVGRFEARHLQAAAVSVNEEYARRTQALREGDEVAILPPVSGGSENTAAAPNPAEDSRPLVQIVTEWIDTERVMADLKAGSDGAVCVFDGIVRDNTRGRRTLHLDYEAYEGMALKQMASLRNEALARFGVREVTIVHRLGRLQVGETSVLIAVASAHRGAAFEACRWVIDMLKKTVPIWKREQFADGAVWVDGEPFPEELAGTGK